MCAQKPKRIDYCQHTIWITSETVQSERAVESDGRRIGIIIMLHISPISVVYGVRVSAEKYIYNEIELSALKH